MRILGFVHIATMGQWRRICDQIFARLLSSGLLSVTHGLYIGVVGDDVFQCNLGEVKYFGGLDLFEYPTLEWLRQSECDLVYYLHTKGASLTESHWEKNKMHFMLTRGAKTYEDLVVHYKRARECIFCHLVDDYKNCISALEHHDICGIDWQNGFFPGNCWWARYSHIQSLGDFDKRTRYGAEMWLGSTPCRVMNLTEGNPCFVRKGYNPIKLL